MFKGLGVARGGPRTDKEPSNTGAEIPRFASQNWLKRFIDSDLEVALKSPIFFQPPTGHVGYGYPCDMICAVGFHRLDLLRLGKDANGVRQYQLNPLSSIHLRHISNGVLASLGLPYLTEPQ